MNYLLIVLGILIVLIAYYVYLIYFTEPIVVKLINLNQSNTAVSGSLIKNPISVKYSYYAWIYISTYPTTLDSGFSPLLSYTPSTGGARTQFVLYLSTPTTLNCGIGSSTSTISGSNNTTSLAGGMNSIVITNNVPIQKWIYVVVSTDGIYADIYLDGKLVVSKVLQNKVNKSLDVNSSITFGTGQDVYLANLTRVPYQVDPQTVWTNYMKGNGQSGMSNLYSSYNGKFVLSDGTSSTDYKIF
jgi:hypothetical protein